MGLEAECSCRWSGGAAPVKALLESRELILRGGPRRTLPFATIQSAAIDGDGLVLTTADETYRLDLGAARAARWKTRIETPPPTLKDKLGLRDGATAFVIGDYCTEINVTSPTGAQQLKGFTGVDATALMWDAIEARTRG